MDFDLTEEQRLLRDSVDRLLAKLLVEKLQVKVDPLTGEVLDSDAGEDGPPPSP